MGLIPSVAEAEMSPKHLPRDEENPFSALSNPLLLASTPCSKQFCICHPYLKVCPKIPLS